MAHAIIFVDRAPLAKNDEYTAQYTSYSAGAYKIASVLRDMGLDVLVVPNCLNYTFAGIDQVIENNKKDLLWVGISSTFMALEVGNDTSMIDQYQKQWNTSKQPTMSIDSLMIKSEYTYDLKLVWGGKDIARLSWHLKKKYNVPLVIGGAWAKTYHSMLQRLKPFNENVYCVESYAECFIKQFTEQRLKNAELPFFADNNHYNDNDFKTSSIHWKPNDFVQETNWLPVEVARGCAFNCAYCSYPRRGRFDSFRNPQSLREELIRNYNEFGVTRFYIVDDLYNDSKEKVKILYDEVWSKLPFQPEWSASMRLDMLWADPDSAEIIRDSGCKFAQFGIETLHNVAGRKVGKGLGRDRILKTLERLKPLWKDDVLVSAGFIAGLPFEPIESIKETMKWTMETDLLYNAGWQPLLITPEDKLTVKNQIDQDNNKYQVEWISNDNWKNSVGVTYKEVVALVAELGRTRSNRFKIHIRNYIDLRELGMTHQRLANIHNEPISDSEIEIIQAKSAARATDRINQIFNLRS